MSEFVPARWECNVDAKGRLTLPSFVRRVVNLELPAVLDARLVMDPKGNWFIVLQPKPGEGK